VTVVKPTPRIATRPPSRALHLFRDVLLWGFVAAALAFVGVYLWIAAV